MSHFSTVVTDSISTSPVTYAERQHPSEEAARGYAEELINRRKSVSVVVLQDGMPIDSLQSTT